MNSVLGALGVFIIIFAPTINTAAIVPGFDMGEYADLLSVFCVMNILWFFIKRDRPKTIREIQVLSGILFATMVYALMSSVIWSGDAAFFHASIRPLRVWITVFGVYSFLDVYRCRFQDDFGSRLMRDVYYAIGIHAAIMATQFFSLSFRLAIYPYTFADRVIDFNQQFRMAGLTNGGGSQLSVYQAMGCLIFPFLKARRATRLLDVGVMLLICLSILLSGRSGVFVVLFFMPIAFVLAGGAALWGWGRRILAVSALFALMASALGKSQEIVSSLGDNSLSTYFNLAIQRDFETFTNYSERGLANDETISFLYHNHLLVPESPVTFFLGDVSNMELDRRGVDSDIGYVRLLFGYGLFGSLLQYAFYLLSLKYLYEIRTQSPALARLGMLMIVVIIIFHAKEVFAFSRIGLSITSLFTFGALAAGRSRRGPGRMGGAPA